MPTAQQIQTLWKAINWPEGRHLQLFFFMWLSRTLVNAGSYKVCPKEFITQTEPSGEHNADSSMNCRIVNWLSGGCWHNNKGKRET